MPLYLLEVVPSPADRTTPTDLLDEIDRVSRQAGAEVIEFQVIEGNAHIFVIAETEQVTSLAEAVPLALSQRDATVTGPDPVRLVGADVSEVKSARSHTPGYLVEWDLPAELSMNDYLARKKANAPKYADVPEVGFLRTYVREDMSKCVCLYDADEEYLVRKARQAVEAPVDRLHQVHRPGTAG
jgi:hypothetical protein